MARQRQIAVENNFVRGRVTEAGPLNFPEKAVTEEKNCVFHQTGKITRRGGFDWEDGYALHALSQEDNEVVVEFLWTSVNGDGDNSILVVQKGNILHFFDVKPDGTVSEEKLPFTVDLRDHTPTNGSQPFRNPCSFTTGLGRLIVSSRAVNPFYVEYTETTSDYSKLVNGSEGDNDNDSTKFPDGVTTTDEWVKFDFGSQVTLKEALWNQSTTATHGDWKWQGSDDDQSWTDIGSSFTLGGTAGEEVLDQMSSNSTAYRYYRLLGVSGSTDGNPWLREVSFTNQDQTAAYVTGDRTNEWTITQSGVTHDDGVESMFDGDTSTGNSHHFNNEDCTGANIFKVELPHLSNTVVQAFRTYFNKHDNTGDDWTPEVQIQGSNDDSMWDDLTGTFFWIGDDSSINIGSLEPVHEQSPGSLGSNTTGYKYYRMRGQTGTTANDEDIGEIEFKSYNIFTTGDRTESIVVTVSDGLQEDPTISATAINLEVRDFDGVDDNLDVDERPTTSKGSMDKDHYYNLLNQGWYFDDESKLDEWDTAFSTMPSNSDVWWYWRDSSDAFDTSLVDDRQLGNSEAPKGHFIIDPFDIDRDTVSGLSGVSTTGDETTVRRPSAIEFFSGRIFYAGVDASGRNNEIYFSRIIENVRHFGECYQKNDPTGSEISQLLSSDGGVIIIPNAGQIIKLIALRSALLVFASNGIWTITGSENLGFSANDFTTQRVASTNALGPQAFVLVKDTPIWWSEDGIYTFQSDDLTSQVQVQALTDEHIKSFYNDEIPSENKKYAKGAYDPKSGVVYFLYNSSSSLTTDQRYSFDRVLALNTLSSAWYTWEISDSDPEIRGLIAITGSALTAEPAIKYTTTYEHEGADKLTFSEPNNTSTFKDWTTYASEDGEESDEKDFTSQFITGYAVHGEGIKDFQAGYILVYLARDANAGGTMRARWDYANDGDSGKFSPSQQLYDDDSNFAYLAKRLDVSGTGKALQLEFNSESGKPFEIHGWVRYESVTQGI